MNMPMIDVPKKAVSLTLDVLYGLHYPRLFLLCRSHLIPVVCEQRMSDNMPITAR
jgi:hypothetical protein